MTISEDENPDKTRKLRISLLSTQTPFNWNLPELHVPIEKYIANQSDKCEVVEDENQFKWMRFVAHLILSYELCNVKRYKEALERVQWCQEHWNTLQAECKEPLFLAVREVLAHAILASKAHILLAAGDVDSALKEDNLLANYPYGDVAHLRSKKNKAGLQGLMAATYLQYSNAYSKALEAAIEARRLDPDQAEWWFILALTLGRIRRIAGNEDISTEELEAIEKAFALHKDASYTVHLAQVYSELSRQMFFKWEVERSKSYALKAAGRLREALALRPNCMNMKARVAHCMLRIHNKEAMDMPMVKALLEEVVENNPSRAMSHVDLGLYYSMIEKVSESNCL